MGDPWAVRWLASTTATVTAQGLTARYDTTRDRGLLTGHQRGPHTATREDLHLATSGDFFMATDMAPHIRVRARGEAHRPGA